MAEINQASLAQPKAATGPASEVAGAGGLLTTGSMVASFAVFFSASCCVLPMILVSAGLGGAWLALLGTLFDYRFPILVIAALVVATGWLVLIARHHSTRVACASGLCGKAKISRSSVVLLSLSTLFILGACLILIYQHSVTRWAFQNRSLWS